MATAAVVKPTKDFQRTAELVNKYMLSTIQFMNRFSASCEERISRASRQLQRVEVQVTLLEYKLDSIDNDSPSLRGKKDAAEKEQLAITAPPNTGAPPPPGITGPPPPPGVGTAPTSQIPLPPGVRGPNAPPAPPNAGRQQPPPPPGFKQPPLPPGMAGQGALAIMGPPILPPNAAMPPPPPPPPPLPGGQASVRTHPKLAGYFKMQEAGVTVSAIKDKMKADGYDPAWFDTPDAPAPLPAAPAKDPKQTLYDSD